MVLASRFIATSGSSYNRNSSSDRSLSGFKPLLTMSSFLATTRPSSFNVPLFLVPAVAEINGTSCITSRRTFSTSPTQASRRTNGPNKQRGVSVIHGKNPKRKTEVYKYPLPVPVIDAARRNTFKTRPDHGLWGFFEQKKRPMLPPRDEAAHGRAWTVKELMDYKSFSDLHTLYWTCVLERNQIATRISEMRRARAGFGKSEAGERLNTVSLRLLSSSP